MEGLDEAIVWAHLHQETEDERYDQIMLGAMATSRWRI
jgi:hypothetical protein